MPDAVLRKADEDECGAFGLSGRDALAQSIRLSDQSFAVMVDGEPVAFWGWMAPSLLGATCHVWMLTTPAIEHHKTYAARESKRIVGELLQTYPALICLVDHEHDLAKKWLHWLGFHVYEHYGRIVEMRVTRKDKPWAS